MGHAHLMAHDHAATGSTITAVILILLLAGQTTAVVGLAAASRMYAARYLVWGLFAAVMGAATFQVLHAIEHVAQFGYWIAHPTQPPWMTPWAMVAMHAFADLGGPSPLAFGTELLHLVGNSIFLVGVASLMLLVRIVAPNSAAHRTTRITLWLQGFHVVEHVMLTLTFLWFGRAAGVSTFFGLVDPGPVLWTYRVWWHFLINAVATVLMLKALREFWPEWNRRKDADLLSGWAAVPRAFAPAHAAEEPVPALLARIGAVDRAKAMDLAVRVIRVVTVAAAVVLGVDVLFVVLGANPHNWMVGLVRGLADGFVLSFRDLFIPDSVKERVLINYGLAAVAYVVLGRIVTALKPSIPPSPQPASEQGAQGERTGSRVMS